jgi:tetratricopeptide (TPR) repeat protein
MKQFFYISIIAVFCFVLSLGFQCGSPELTSAKLYYQQKNWDKALEAAEKEVKTNPNSVDGWYFLGLIRVEKKDYKGMAEAFKTCLSVDPVKYKKDIENTLKFYFAQAFNSGVSNFNKAKKDNSAESYDRAATDFKNAIEVEPDSIGTYWNLAATYQNKGDAEHALEAYKSIIDKTHDIKAYIILGDFFLEKGNLLKGQFDNTNKDKIELLNKFQMIEKKVSKETVRKHLGEPDEIKKPEAPPVKKGKKKVQEEQKEEWIYKKYNLHIYFDKDLVTDKKFDPPYEVKIDSTDYFKASKEYEKAIDWYTKAKDIAPDSMKLNLLEALTKLYTTVNKLDIAIKSYEELCKSDPKNKNYHYFLGVLYLNSKRYEDATSQFKIVIELDPNDEKSLYNLFAVFNNWAIKIREEIINSEKEDTTYLKILRQGLPYIQRLNELKPDNLDYIDPFRQLCGIFQMKPELENLLVRLKDMETKYTNSAQYWDIMFKIYMNLNKQSEATKALDKSEQLRKQK